MFPVYNYSFVSQVELSLYSNIAYILHWRVCLNNDAEFVAENLHNRTSRLELLNYILRKR